MPIKTSSGKWKWGNVERSSKKELVQTVYGIWKKNGSKGSFSDFLKGTHESVEPKDKFFKVKKNGKEIGKYGLSFYDDIKAVGIGDLEVYPEFRNKGYGTKIIKDIVDRYKNDYDKIYCFVDKDNKDAIRLYKRLGKVSDKVTYSQKIGDYEYKNTNGQHYVEFYNKLKESVVSEKNFKLYAYDIDTDKLWFHGTKLEVESFKSRPPTPDNIFYVAQNIKYAKKYGKNIYAIKLSDKLNPFNPADEKCLKDVERIFPEFVSFCWIYGIHAYIKGFDDKGQVKIPRGQWTPIDLLSFARDLFPSKKDKEYYDPFLQSVNWSPQSENSDIPETFVQRMKQSFDEYLEWLKKNGCGDLIGAKKTIDGVEKIRKLLLKKLHENGYNSYLGIEIQGQTKSAIIGVFDISAIDKIGLYDSKKKDTAKESYEPPYTFDTIKQKYGDEVYRKLRDDPVHRFRAETGIEVIHKEPTRDEFERIVKNWDLMTPEQKKRSDEFSMKQFGKNNKDRIDNIRKEYLKEYWAKNGRYFYCHDCDKNMTKAPDDQYIMIDDDLWEYVCKHGGKKIGTEEDLCRDCIEKRLGRPLTLKDLGDKINLPINVEIKKLLKKRKNKMTNEAYEIHSYPEKLQPTLERIVKDNEDYELDHAYFNKEGKFIWMRNSKGYFHVFKPVKFVKTPGMTKPFGFKDLILKDNGMLEEVDRLRFADGNEGLKFLKDKYHLELKTIS